MIISLLEVGLLVMGVGVRTSAPISLNSQPQEEQETTITLDKQYANEEGLQSFSLPTNEHNLNNRYYTDIEAGEGYVYQHIKWSGSNYNSVMQIESASYDENKLTSIIENPYYDNATFEEQDTQVAKWMATFNNTYMLNDGWDYSTMKVIKVTPNMPTGSTTIKAKFKVTIMPQYLYNSNTNKVTYNTRVQTYSSINTEWANVVNGEINVNNGTITWQTGESLDDKPYNQYVYEYINNPANGYNYSYTEQYVETIQNGNDYIEKPKEATNDIYLVNGETNYVIIFLRTEATIEGANEGYFIDQNTSLKYFETYYTYARIYHSDPTYFEGQYFIGTINQEVIDIPGLMWEILTMPFAFISTAFNLTLFPGTQYSVNISNLIMVLFGVLVFLFIMNLLRKTR